MKQLTLLLICCCFSAISFSQVKTINANQNNKVLLIFDEPIKQGLPGSSDFFFGYNKEKPEKMGYLNARKGSKPSNLFIVTTDGKMYSFTVKYKEVLDPEEYTNIISVKNSLQYKETSKSTAKIVVENDTLVSSPISTDNYDYHYQEENPTEKHYTEISKKIIKIDEKLFRRQLRVEEDVFFSLKNYYYNKEELYFYFEIENKSKIDFDINFLSFLITNKKKNRHSLTQQVLMGNDGNPDFTYNLPKRIKTGEIAKFVCVFKKFTLNQDKALIVNLTGLKDERVLELKLLSKIVNNPQKI